MTQLQSSHGVTSDAGRKKILSMEPTDRGYNLFCNMANLLSAFALGICF